jgi:hypothetical protein
VRDEKRGRSMSAAKIADQLLHLEAG